MSEGPGQATMSAVQLLGHGGPDRLVYRRDLAVPRPAADEVLIRVLAAGVNNTDINTRIGWYSKSVSGGTDTDVVASGDDGAWSDQPISFPRIQGADCCGEIVAVGAEVDPARIGERVLVRPMQNSMPRGGPERTVTFGSEFDGGFAEFAVNRASETYRVDSDWSDVELASIPCAWSTAEGMLHRASVGSERVVVTGASGGVGSAAIQLAKRRGAEVIAVAGKAKAQALLDVGADRVLDRNADMVAELGANSIDVFVDVVAGPTFAAATTVLRPGGRYVVAGAIGGPLVELDVRDLYLKDLTLIGSTTQDPQVFADLISYIEAGAIRPMIAATYPLADIAAAQSHFDRKDFVGKIVLTVGN